MTKVPALPYNYSPDDTQPPRPPSRRGAAHSRPHDPCGPSRKAESPAARGTRVKSLVTTTMKKELQVIYRLVMISKRVYLKKRRINKVCNYTWLMTVPKAPSTRAACSAGTADRGGTTRSRPSAQAAVGSISLALSRSRKHLGRDALVYAK